MTTKRRTGTVRIDLHIPPELAAEIDRRATGGNRNALLVGDLARLYRIPLRPEDVAPRPTGRPRKKADGEAASTPRR